MQTVCKGAGDGDHPREMKSPAICYNKNSRNLLCFMGLQVLFGKDHGRTHGGSHSAKIRL